MAIADDHSSTAAGGATRWTVTWQHQIGASQGLLLVGLATSFNPVSTTHSTVTFHGVSMNPVGAVQRFTSNFHGLELFYLVNPDVGTWDIVATAPDAYSSIAGGGLSFTGVDQTTPLGTPAAAVITSEALEATVSSAAGEVVVDVAACTYSGTVITADASQAQKFEESYGDSGDGEAARRRVGMSTEGGAASVAMTWTGQNSDGAAIIAVPVKPAAASSVTWLRHRA